MMEALLTPIDATLPAKVFNASPHIHDIDNTLEEVVRGNDFPALTRSSYCIPHHHFKLEVGEVLLFDVNESGGVVHEVKVSCSAYDSSLYPFQYFSDGTKYVPVGFTRDKRFMCPLPAFHKNSVGIITSLASTRPLMELSNNEDRVQVLSTSNGDAVVESSLSNNQTLRVLTTVVAKRLDGDKPDPEVQCVKDEDKEGNKYHHEIESSSSNSSRLMRNKSKSPPPSSATSPKVEVFGEVQCVEDKDKEGNEYHHEIQSNSLVSNKK